MKAKRNQHLY